MSDTIRSGHDGLSVEDHSLRTARLLSRIVEESRELVAAIDSDYRLIAVRRAYRDEVERRFGVRIELGDDLREAAARVSSPCDDLVPYWSRALAGEEYTTVVAVPTPEHPEGTRYAEMRFRPLHAPDGTIEGAFQRVHDVTAREVARSEAAQSRRAEEVVRQSRDLLWAVLNSTTDAVFVKDLAGRYLLINPAGAEMVGRSVDEVIGRTDEEIFETRTAFNALCRDREVIERGEVRTSEQEGTAAGVTRTYLTTKSPLRDENGHIIGVVGVARDVTQMRRSERALRAERELLERLIDTIPVMITLYRSDLGRFRVDREFERLIGWTTEEAATIDLMEKCYPDPAYRAQAQAFMQSLEEGWRDFEVTTKDGGTIESSWANIRLSDDVSVGIGIDIRERRRTERALRFLSEASMILTRSLDYETTLRMVAELAVPQIADWCAVDLLDGDEIRCVAVSHLDEARKQVAQEYRRRYPDRLDDEFGIGAVIRTGEPELYTELPEWSTEPTLADEKRRCMLEQLGLRSVLIVPLEAAGTRLGAISFGQSDSGRIFAQDDLLLAGELARRAAGAIQNARAYSAEQRAREAAEQAIHAKDQFLAMVSHELRTPLTTVLGYADLLAGGIGGPLNARQKEFVHRVQQGALHLVAIIDDILSFARSEAGKEELRIAPIDAAALARDVISLLEPEAKRKGIAVRTRLDDERLILETDGGKLRQILANLVGNAVKFTDRGEVALDVDTSHATSVSFHVRDTGPGIDPAVLERIFEPFTQADSSPTREKGGTGLGLTICRRYARLLGGEITVASTLGVGSTFTLCLPRRYANGTG